MLHFSPLRRLPQSTMKAATEAVLRRGIQFTPEVSAALTGMSSAVRGHSWCPMRSSLARRGFLGSTSSAEALRSQARFFTQLHAVGVAAPSRVLLNKSGNNATNTAGSGQLETVRHIEKYTGEEEEQRREEEEEQEQEGSTKAGYLPFPAPFHTINPVMFLILANILCYIIMNYTNDDIRDFLVEHFTLSHDNWMLIYPLFTCALYQENGLQLLIDCWLLRQFGRTMLEFLGNTRITFFALLCTLGGSLLHIAQQKFALYYGKDELEVCGRCYGCNSLIMGMITIEGLIFRHLNFIQQPPIPFLIVAAFAMVIDVWRLFTVRAEEHTSPTGGALIAYVFWALPTRMLGLDKLTAAL